jgi:hypothetical protein
MVGKDGRPFLGERATESGLKRIRWQGLEPRHARSKINQAGLSSLSHKVDQTSRRGELKWLGHDAVNEASDIKEATPRYRTVIV